LVALARHHVLSDSTASENAIRQGDVWTVQERMELHMNNDIQRGLANLDAL
jgi:hypothetical protein